jgi:FtsH-binding integral membrane protein
MDNFEQQEPRLVNPDASGLNNFFKKVYLYMALALMVTAGTAYIGATVFAAPIVRIFSSPISSLIIFGIMMGFAVLNGFTFTVIGLTVNFGLIALAFLTTSFLFVGMAAYGYFTKKSLASLSSILFGSLIALIIGGIINLFFFNSVVYFFLSVVGVLVFAVMTAYDMNRLKALYLENGEKSAQMTQSIAVSGALNLYMDFINLFIYILQLFTSFSSRD